MNIMIVMSDEHSYHAMGSSGHELVKTPVMDKLAEEGAMFTNCYTNSPLCAPARASFFTSQYVNKLGTWDNATPYDGKILGMSQQLKKYEYEMQSFGKWDFHPDSEYDGLIAQMPGNRTKPDIECLFREDGVPRVKAEERFKSIGIRETQSHDDKVRDLAVKWLKEDRPKNKPWILYVGFTDPHFPFYVKEEYWNYYNEKVKNVPKVAQEPFTSLNEPLKALRHHFRGDVADEETVRRAHAGYYASTNELDDNIGALVNTLEEQEVIDDTLIIYTSDHGEQLGHHGLWWKCCMFEESAHVPLIIKGPGIKKGIKEDTLVSLLDIFPTICDSMKVPIPSGIEGRSLKNLASGLRDIEREDFIFSEYHAHGMPVGMYMIRWENWKYVYYVGYDPQLFNLKEDPGENEDLYSTTQCICEAKDALEQCHKRLLKICNPEEVDRRAKENQKKVKEDLCITDNTCGDKAVGRAAHAQHIGICKNLLFK